jgi:hypothetical protein
MTTEQLDLFAPLAQVTYDEDLTLAQRYEQFAAANPHVIDAFERLTEQWLNAGHKRVGMKAVAEKARWESGIQSHASEWKINNSFVSFIARELIRRRPEWTESIETRVQKAAS